MSKDLFSYSSYKAYISALIRAQPKQGRGMKAQLAEAIQSPTSHVSQVLGGDSHLSLEQADRANRFFGHSSEEAEYFLLLVQWERAGTAPLKAHFDTLRKRMLEKRLVLKDRVDVKATLSLEDQMTYYSSWYFAAVHVLLTVPALRTQAQLSRHLGLSSEQVGRALDFLVRIGLAKHQQGRYEPGPTRLFLGTDSGMINKHHINWRMAAVQSLDAQRSDEDMHYSSMVSVSREDSMRIKAMLVEAIGQVRAVIKDSAAEDGYCFALDWFAIGNRESLAHR